MGKTPLILFCTILATICLVQAIVAWQAFEETNHLIFVAFLVVSAVATVFISTIVVLIVRER